MPATSTTDEGKKRTLTAVAEERLRTLFAPYNVIWSTDDNGTLHNDLLFVLSQGANMLREIDLARAERDAERAKVARLQRADDEYESLCELAQRLEAERDAAFAAGRAEGIEAAAQAVVARAVELGRQECCGRGINCGDHEECCGDPLYLISEVEADKAIRALLPSPAVGGKEGGLAKYQAELDRLARVVEGHMNARNEAVEARRAAEQERDRLRGLIDNANKIARSNSCPHGYAWGSSSCEVCYEAPSND